MSVSHGHGSASLVSKPARLPIRDRRSAVACLTCRRRKIRCDVTVNGSPCTNCRLDNDRCLIVGSKRPRKTKNADRSHESPVSLANTGPSGRLLITRQITAPVISVIHAAVTPPDRLYPSVLSADTSRLSSHAIAYLASQQALTLPKKAIIHTLLQYYFVRVYPAFPLIKESSFRESTQNERPFSLLVFRAMLFAASCHIPIEAAEDAGYSSIWHIRQCLYKTTKNLYDFGIEKDPLHIAQATLLLAFHFEYSDPMGNTTWHAIAVQNARLANAHRSQAPLEYNIEIERLSDLKRLWWCCILGDRLLALGTRRPVSITLDQFDPTNPIYLTMDEVWDDDSEYYTQAGRNVLYQGLINACRLAVLLAPGALSTDYSPDLMGPNVCIEKRKMFSDEIMLRLSSYNKYHQQLLHHDEVRGDLAVAANLHFMSLIHIGARLAVFNRHIVLYLSRCRCSRGFNEMDNLDLYLHGLLGLVSDTNDEVRWFDENQLLYFLPTITRCSIFYQNALNLFWFHGHELDEEIRDPAPILRYYSDIDDDYGVRYGTGSVTHFVRHVVRLVIGVYDASAGAVLGSTQNNFVQPNGKLEIGSLSIPEKVRTAKISHLLSLVVDYGFSTGDWHSVTSDTISLILRRIRTVRPVNDCSLTNELPAFSTFSYPQFTPSVNGTATPESNQSSGDTPKSWGDSQSSHTALSTQVVLPASSISDSAPWSKGKGNDGTSLERFDAAAKSFSQHSMQEWAGELEEFMGPLIGM